MLKVVTFKWQPSVNQKVSIPAQSIGGYTSENVNIFFDMIDRNLSLPHRNYCITDNQSGLNSSIEYVRLWNMYRTTLGGCYDRLFIFSQSIKEYLGPGPYLFCDMDMVITSNIDSLIHKAARPEGRDFCYYKMRGADGTGSRMNNSLIYLHHAYEMNYVWGDFSKDPEDAIASCKHIAGTDQAWCNHRIDLKSYGYWDMHDGIYDFRLDFLEKDRIELPEDCKIVMFPGPRAPWEIKWRTKYPWINQYYKLEGK